LLHDYIVAIQTTSCNTLIHVRSVSKTDRRWRWLLRICRKNRRQTARWLCRIEWSCSTGQRRTMRPNHRRSSRCNGTTAAYWSIVEWSSRPTHDDRRTDRHRSLLVSQRQQRRVRHTVERR